MKTNSDYTIKRVIEAPLYNNRWVPNGRSMPGKYLRRLFVLDLDKAFFGYYNDNTKTTLGAIYSLKVHS